jgi:regulator of RNase E activity RraA
LGHRHDQPLEQFIAKIAGSLYTTVLSDVPDDLEPCDVVALGCGDSRRIAPWGELLTTASRRPHRLRRRGVSPGDLVVGDADGVIVVPRDIESVVLDNALAKVAGEDRTRDALLRGAKLRDVFAEYNVL